MTTKTYVIREVSASDFRFSRKGEIVFRGQVVGDWTVSYPKKEMAAKGCRGIFPERAYRWGFPYRGSYSAYSRVEMVAKILEFAKREGMLYKVTE